MILMKDIIREGNELLRNESTDITIPVSDEDKRQLLELLGYVINSQDVKMQLYIM